MRACTVLLALAIALARGAGASVTIASCGYIGGADREDFVDVAVDPSGNSYVAGLTHSLAFPVAVGPDLSYNGDTDGFLEKVKPDGSGLDYAGYIGGDLGDDATAVAVNAAGEAYVSGKTWSSPPAFPVRIGPDLTFNGGSDAYVARVTADGTALAWCGYVGGSQDESSAFGMALDGAGNAYVTGQTDSSETSFPVAVGPDLTFNDPVGWDGFVAEVRGDGGGLVYAGYLGGASGLNAADFAEDVAVDAAGSAFISGRTVATETTFPVTVGPDLTSNGSVDGYAAKVQPGGAGLDYAGYIGGVGGESAKIALAPTGAAIVVGNTSSNQATFPVGVGPDLTYNGGGSDAFVVEVRPDGTGLAWAGFLGGDQGDAASGVAADASGDAVVVGFTDSSELTFPVLNGPGSTYNGNGDEFAAKVDASGTRLLWSGYLGGAAGEIAGRAAVALAPSGEASVVGITRSDEASFPVRVGPALVYAGGGDAFLARLHEDGCIAVPAELAGLLAVKSRDDVAMEWRPDPGARGTNLWTVARKSDIPVARQSGIPVAMGVAGCSTPAPAPANACTDAGAVPRSPVLLFYQARAFCDAASEGP